MYDQSQLMRGTLEGCILKIISLRETYGYEIVLTLQSFGFQDAREGTIYPILVRLEKKQMIKSRFCPSPLGPDRKYYSVTPEGMALFKEFTDSWESVSAVVAQILAYKEETP